MKKGGILHPQLARILAELGHGDRLVIADAGLPIPLNTERIDLGFAPGKPSFIEVLQAIKADIEIQGFVLAQEIMQKSPGLEAQIRAAMGGLMPGFIAHEALKEQVGMAKAVIRTGEFTPYANAVLISGVPF